MRTSTIFNLHSRAEPCPAARDAADLVRAQERQRQQREVLEEKEAFIATLLERLRQPQGVEEGPDDFKRITGVGPVIEALLHSMGITTFEQVAAFSDDDASRVGDLLGAFRERIQRDRWIEQAAEFARRRFRPGDCGDA